MARPGRPCASTPLIWSTSSRALSTVPDQSPEHRCRCALRISRRSRSSCPSATRRASAPFSASVAGCLRFAIVSPDDAVSAPTGPTMAASLGCSDRGKG
jgi:hypothetical protein